MFRKNELLEQHPLVILVRSLGEGGYIKTPENGTVFWSNNYQQGKNGMWQPWGRTHSEICVKNMRSQGREYCTLGDIEASLEQYGYINLDAIWSAENAHLTSPEVKVYLNHVISSYYAKNATGDVTVSVGGTDKISVFRTTELPALMMNKAITYFNIITHDEADLHTVERMTKDEAYQYLRSEWFKTHKDRFIKAHTNNNSNIPTAIKERFLAEIVETLDTDRFIQNKAAQNRYTEATYLIKEYHLTDDISAFRDKTKADIEKAQDMGDECLYGKRCNSPDSPRDEIHDGLLSGNDILKKNVEKLLAEQAVKEKKENENQEQKEEAAKAKSTKYIFPRCHSNDIHDRYSQKMIPSGGRVH